MRVFVDTNVLVCLFDSSEPAKQARARTRRRPRRPEAGAATVLFDDLQTGRTCRGVRVEDPFAP